MIQGKFLYGSEKLEEIIQVRRSVCMETENDCNMWEEDPWDADAIHVVINETEDCVVAVGRLRQDDTIFRMDRILVHPLKRGRYYGDFVVRMLLDKAFSLGAKEVVVLATPETVLFFEKIGFVAEDAMASGDIPMKIQKSYVCKGCQKEK